VKTDRSIKKVIQKEYFNAIFSEKGMEDLKSKIYEAIFEPNLSLDEPVFLFLKEDIIEMSRIETILQPLNISKDIIERIKQLFIADHDLILPNSLRKAFIESEKLAIFIGAGVSKLLGIPLWEELADNAIEYIREEGYINYLEKGRLQKDFSSKQRLTLCHEIMEKHGKLKEFYSENMALKADKKKEECENPYEKLIELDELGANILKITTNIDECWETTKRNWEERNVMKGEAERVENIPAWEVMHNGFSSTTPLDRKCLYKIHGTINDIERAVITTRQYVDAYRNKNGLQGFLENVFKEYTVIFIGSGMQEFEILEHCLKEKHKEHYALVGMFTGEEHLFRVKKKYFEELKIQPIPYYRDYDDYHRIILILDAWIQEIRSLRSIEYLDNQKILDEVLRI
jgi:hypothetical protein